MAKAKEFHTNQKTEVYHIFRDCTLGNNIEVRNRTSGKGGKRLCKRCKRRREAKES